MNTILGFIYLCVLLAITLVMTYIVTPIGNILNQLKWWRK